MSASGQPVPITIPPAGAPALVPAPPAPKKRRWVIGLAAVIVAAASITTYALATKAKQAPQAAPSAGIRTFKAVTGSLVKTVRISGVSSARNYALITIPVFRGPESRANLTLIKVAQGGSMVKKGDIVALMDTQSAQDHIDDTKDELLQAEQDMLKRKAEQAVDWGNLQQTLKLAQANLDKATLDHRAGEVKTEVERELLRLNLEEAQATYKQRLADLAVTKAGDAAELRILEIAYQRNKIHLDRHLMDIVKFEVKAPMSGLVVMQPIFRSGEMAQIQAGDQVAPGQQIMKIVDPNSMQVEGSVNQAESGLLRIGQTATIGLDAFPELRLQGEVYSMGALAAGASRRENYFIRNVPVRVTIKGSDPRLIPDLSAWAEVEVERHDNVVMVPREAVQKENGQTVVYVKAGGQFQKRPVTLGASNHIRVAVLEGLREGEEVALARP